MTVEAGGEITKVLQEVSFRQRRNSRLFALLMFATLFAAGLLILGAERLQREVASLNAQKANIGGEIKTLTAAKDKANSDLNETLVERDMAQRDLETLKKSIDQNRADLILENKKLADQGALLTGQVSLYEKSYTTVRKTLAALPRSTSTAVTEVLPFAAVAVPVATSELISKGGRKPTYRFSISLTIPPERKDQVAKVVYAFDHPTFKTKTMESSDPSTNFQVSYLGWGALENVTITIDTRDGRTEQIPFNMAHALGWK